MAVTRSIPARAAAAVLFCALIAGCGDAAFSFGNHPDVIWWTDHESGDLSDWTGSVAPGGFILTGNSRIEVVKGLARSGEYALLVQDNSHDTRDYPLAARNGPLPTDVYCSAWYYMPAPLRPSKYWWFFLFRSRQAPYDSVSKFRDEIALSFTPRSDGSVVTSLLQRSSMLPPDSPELDESVPPVVELPVPVAQWFHIEVFHRTGTDDTGHVTVWQDGELTFDVGGRNSETNHAEWMIGGVVDALTTNASQLYIDDAAISKRRLGPAPPFTRE
jgi:hypothetical protein